MKNVLALTDFSTIADNAAEYAVKLAYWSSANAILFHASAASEKLMIVPAGSADDCYVDAPNQCRLKLEVLRKKLQISLKNATGYTRELGYIINNGPLDEHTYKIVTEKRIDLIVMGAHQYTGFPDFLFGNHVSSIIEKVNCPVLLIPEGVVFRQVKNIFYATDLRYSDLQMITFLTDFARPFKARISLLHVCSDGLPDLQYQEAKSLFLDVIASQTNYSSFSYYGNNSGDAESVINEVIKNQQMDILAVAHRKYHFFKHIFKGCINENIAAYTRIPLLVLPVK